MRDVTKLALSSLVLLAGLDPSVGTLAISHAVDVAPVHAGRHHHAGASRPSEVRARPGVSVRGHQPHQHAHQRDHRQAREQLGR